MEVDQVKIRVTTTGRRRRLKSENNRNPESFTGFLAKHFRDAVSMSMVGTLYAGIIATHYPDFMGDGADPLGYVFGYAAGAFIGVYACRYMTHICQNRSFNFRL